MADVTFFIFNLAPLLKNENALNFLNCSPRFQVTVHMDCASKDEKLRIFVAGCDIRKPGWYRELANQNLKGDGQSVHVEIAARINLLNDNVEQVRLFIFMRNLSSLAVKLSTDHTSL